MSSAPQTSILTEDEHAAEVAAQNAIKAEVTAAEAESKTQQDAEAVAAQPLVTIRSKNVETYPLTVSVVGGLDLVFEDESATLEVVPEVAEQVTYLTNVEVVA